MPVKHEQELTDMAERACALAGVIRQEGWPMPNQFPSARPHPMPHGPDKELQNVELALGSVVAAIEEYLRQRAT